MRLQGANVLNLYMHDIGDSEWQRFKSVDWEPKQLQHRWSGTLQDDNEPERDYEANPLPTAITPELNQEIRTYSAQECIIRLDHAYMQLQAGDRVFDYNYTHMLVEQLFRLMWPTFTVPNNHVLQRVTVQEDF